MSLTSALEWLEAVSDSMKGKGLADYAEMLGAFLLQMWFGYVFRVLSSLIVIYQMLRLMAIGFMSIIRTKLSLPSIETIICVYIGAVVGVVSLIFKITTYPLTFFFKGSSRAKKYE